MRNEIGNAFCEGFKFDRLYCQYCYALIDLSGRSRFRFALHVAVQLGL
jgi:hypothetical protein